MKKVITGVKPTGTEFHIGNYFGAVKQLIDLQNMGNEMIAFVPDLHGLNTLHNPDVMRKNIINGVRSYLAGGVDPSKTLIFKQSDVPAHAELNWVLGAITPMGFMKRMHAYKDALDKGKGEDITMGTFNYPILMAADILLYDIDLVPVGKDQKQHVEFARDIAIKFNNMFGDTFVIPDSFIKEEVAVIPGIDGRKMSKSYNNYIGIFDTDEVILKKVKSIVTDAIPVESSKDPDKDNIYNILRLLLTPEEDADIRQKYLAGGLSFKYAKDYLYEKFVAFVSPMRKKAEELSDEYISDLLKKGSVIANETAEKKIDEVYRKVGIR